MTRRVVSLFGRHLAGGTPSPPGLDALTDREGVLAWVATGRSNQEIAKELFLSPAIVRTHISRAMGKLGVALTPMETRYGIILRTAQLADELG